jgi:hypothetical protein
VIFPEDKALQFGLFIAFSFRVNSRVDSGIQYVNQFAPSLISLLEPYAVVIVAEVVGLIC